MNTKAVMSIPRQPVWSGDGLPPVGTTCEAWHNGSAQGVVEARYAGDFMVLWNVERKHEQCSAAKDYWFRPIRTPEQIATEERETAVAAMVAIMCKDGAFDADDPECAFAMATMNIRAKGRSWMSVHAALVINRSA